MLSKFEKEKRIKSGKFAAFLSDKKKKLRQKLLNNLPEEWHNHVREAFMFNDEAMIQELEYMVTKQNIIRFVA